MYKNAILILAVLLFSCKKEATELPKKDNPLIGTWSFVNLDYNVTNVNYITNSSGLVVSRIMSPHVYVTQQNSGELVIDGDLFHYNNIRYIINARLGDYVYKNTILIDSTFRTVNDTTTFTEKDPYHLLVSDSISVIKGTNDNGSIFRGGIGDQKYALSGDTLRFTFEGPFVFVIFPDADTTVPSIGAFGRTVWTFVRKK
ncbi:hypothetical protein [Chitinophaga sp. S165]|uniref:hypothetical protein n=1 Tax=Chitinophaga sp. S165 TaxID=2135462 RepID=UPI000D716984|nr:hypothetical protein [Chitinophaga sp. S165]PWV50818.1 hypothetical protein C7475_104449 [Chitinophaga sp. S165]